MKFCNITAFIFFSLFVIQIVSSESDKPNVVIFYTDDQGTLDAGCYGSTDLHTPHIDRIAANGVRFTQAYATPFVVLPARHC